MFLETETAQCNDDARAAIREAFHDCGAWNKAQGSTSGYNGSLILTHETDRPENNGLQDISVKLLVLAKKHGVGVADMIQFAAARLGLSATLSEPPGFHAVRRIEALTLRKTTRSPLIISLIKDSQALSISSGASIALDSSWCRAFPPLTRDHRYATAHQFSWSV